MVAPAIRTIAAKQVRDGRMYRFEQDTTETLDYSMDFAECFASSITLLESVSITVPTGLTATSIVITGLVVTFNLAASGATVGEDYRVTVQGTVNSGAIKLECSFTVGARDE